MHESLVDFDASEHDQITSPSRRFKLEGLADQLREVPCVVRMQLMELEFKIFCATMLKDFHSTVSGQNNLVETTQPVYEKL